MVTRSHCPQVTKEELEGDRWWELYQDTKRESTSGKVSLSCKIIEWIQANCRIWAAPNLTGYMKRLLTQDRLGQGSPESCPEWFQWDRCRTSSTRGGLQAWCTRGTRAKTSQKDIIHENLVNKNKVRGSDQKARELYYLLGINLGSLLTSWLEVQN